MSKTNRVLPKKHNGHSKHNNARDDAKDESSNNTRDNSTHRHHKMVNTKIRWIIFFVAEAGEAPYHQQKQDQQLTVAQIVNSYCKIET